MICFSKVSGRLIGKYAALLVVFLLMVDCARHQVAFHPENPVPPQRVNHKLWDSILKKHVADGKVDYVSLRTEDSANLETYLDMIARTNPPTLSNEEELAFWINAYNACVVKAVLDGYSPQTLWGRYRMFCRAKFMVGGASLSLNDMERYVGQSRFHDPRVYFALTRGCQSCPALQGQAYSSDNIDHQLQLVTTEFASDNTKNKVDEQHKVLYLSRIFDWRKKEILASGVVPQTFFLGYLDKPVEEKKPYRLFDVKYLPFDWKLNGETHK